MANTTVQLKKSGVTGNVPPSLSYGELALNYADGKLFYRHANNSIASISTGTATNSFATVNSNSSLILASSSTDTLSFAAANTIRITTNTTTKLITIGSTALANQTGTFGGDLTVAGNVITTGSGGNITGANVVSANSFNASVSYIFSDGTIQTTAASPASYSQAAFALANNNTGVNTTQNTSISIIQGVDLGQNTRMTIIEGVDTEQNTRMTIIEGVDTTQNTNITTATTLAQAAFDKANTGVGVSTDDYARQIANAAFQQANTGTVLAQAAFDKANTGVTSGTTIITGGQYVDYGWVPMTPAPVLFDYGTL
jgi:hypothetical protein